MGSASEIAAKLNLNPHPEGGFYSETFRDTSVILSKSLLSSQYKVDRPVSTCIYFLLPSGCVSRLHRIPCAETWHFYKGEPITVLELTEEDGKVKLTCLGSDLMGGNQQLQYTVPPNVWFGAFPTKDFIISSDGAVQKSAPRDAESHYSLVGCTCAPAFQFEDFELAKRSELISRFPSNKVGRPVSTCIYFSLPSGSVSHLHHIPCAKTRHFFKGEPITVLELNEEDGKVKLTCLGSDLIEENQQPQHTVAPNVWFGAFPTKDFIIFSDGAVQKAAPRDAESHYSLVGCSTCAPAFQFEDFELAKRSELILRFPSSEALFSLLTLSD